MKKLRDYLMDVLKEEVSSMDNAAKPAQSAQPAKPAKPLTPVQQQKADKAKKELKGGDKVINTGSGEELECVSKSGNTVITRDAHGKLTRVKDDEISVPTDDVNESILIMKRLAGI